MKLLLIYLGYECSNIIEKNYDGVSGLCIYFYNECYFKICMNY